MIRAVLFDLDGVIRHFDPRHVTAIERRHGIDPGAISDVAFAPPLIERVTTGRMSRREWIAQIGAELGNEDAAAEWGRHPSEIDQAIVELGLVPDEFFLDVRMLGMALRDHGVRVA